LTVDGERIRKGGFTAGTQKLFKNLPYIAMPPLTYKSVDNKKVLINSPPGETTTTYTLKKKRHACIVKILRTQYERDLLVGLGEGEGGSNLRVYDNGPVYRRTRPVAVRVPP